MAHVRTLFANISLNLPCLSVIYKFQNFFLQTNSIECHKQNQMKNKLIKTNNRIKSLNEKNFSFTDGNSS